MNIPTSLMVLPCTTGDTFRMIWDVTWEILGSNFEGNWKKFGKYSGRIFEGELGINWKKNYDRSGDRNYKQLGWNYKSKPEGSWEDILRNWILERTGKKPRRICKEIWKKSECFLKRTLKWVT